MGIWKKGGLDLGMRVVSLWGCNGAGVSWAPSQPLAAAASGWRRLEDNAQWTEPSMTECAALQGRRAIVDVAHQPTALQVRCNRLPPFLPRSE
jgi:hypothetical protein